MKLALAHDYLTQLGGAEKVLTSFLRIFPNSKIYVLMHNKRVTGGDFPPHKVHSSWLQYLPSSGRNHHWYLIFMPRATESHKLDKFDIILSSASSFAKGIKKPERGLHICYCHTPTRYLWHDSGSYIEELNYNRFLKKIIPLFLGHIKNWDYLAAQNVDIFIANSRVVQSRIKKYYHADSTVIYPPVETDKFYISPKVGKYYLIGGRLVSYKKYDLAVRAFNKLGIKLKVYGTGPEFKRLKKIARPNVEFTGPINDKEKARLLSECRAFIYPQVEDFGITAVEAMASGRPVIAYGSGGATETVIPGVTGEFFAEQNWESLVHAILHFDYTAYDPKAIRTHAEKFSTTRFEREIKEFVDKSYKKYKIDRIFQIKK